MSKTIIQWVDKAMTIYLALDSSVRRQVSGAVGSRRQKVMTMKCWERKFSGKRKTRLTQHMDSVYSARTFSHDYWYDALKR